MKYTFLLKAYVPVLALLLSVSSIRTEVIWNGSTNPDVIDDDIRITGNVKLASGANRISAINHNITVDVDLSVCIAGNNSDESILYLRADENRTIRFKIDHTTKFIGSSNEDPLTIIQHGAGCVEFCIEGDNDVLFTSSGESGPTHYYLVMSDCGEDEYYENPKNNRVPTLLFKRDLGDNEDDDIHVIIGPNSRMTYIAPGSDPIAEETGCIAFEPYSSGEGQMFLEVEDTGAFLMNGHKVNYEEVFDCANIQPDDIDLTTPCGSAVAKVLNNTIMPREAQENIVKNINVPNVSLIVLNHNNTLSELLFDPFCNLGVREDNADYNGLFGGVQYGFILGANATMQIASDRYLDYVGLTNNQCPDVEVPEFNLDAEQLLKPRNASAFVVDGYLDPTAEAAKIELSERSGIFFRSGVAVDGTVDALSDYLVNPTKKTPGAGEIVFDVEGELNIYGPDNTSGTSSKLEILSWEVCPSGGALFAESSETIFPKRTFNTENGQYLSYNCAAFLVNNNMNLYDTSLMHTDECHQVFHKNDSKSEPTYIGGETFTLKNDVSRPRIAFHNARLLVHSDMAITGLDLCVPNTVAPGFICEDNHSQFIFYHNGFCVDNGTGRNLNLGTRVGAVACDGCSLIDCDAHLDVIQLFDCIFDAGLSEGDNHVLQLRTASNGECIAPGLGNTSKLSIHTIYLGCESNISIGSNDDEIDFEVETSPCLEIGGNFFSFETRGGPLRRPETSNITGKGGIFVDLNGKFSIGSDYRASISTMVTKSRNAIIDLPKAQIFFDDMIGIADWRLDLSDEESVVIVPSTMCISDYTLNWLAIQKDCANFCPYELGDVTVCQCPEVTQMNVTSLPTIQGTVDQMQIQASRIGDQAHLMIDGGHVRELVFLPGTTSAEAPVAAIFLKNDGRIGIGPLEQSHDSTFASTTLGVNGISIIADGEGRVDLNQDMIVNNICAFLKGPNFSSGDVLQISTIVPRELRVKKGGTLDFSSFNGSDDVVEFCGDIRIVLEPGARIIMGNNITFADEASILFEGSTKVEEFFQAIPLGAIDNTLSPTAVVDASLSHNEFASLTNYGDGLENTNDFRVIIAGTGALLFRDNATVELPYDAFVGIETIDECITETDVTIELQESAKWNIGILDTRNGGGMQIGNVVDREGHTVNFTLTLAGNDAEFEIGRLGFFGIGVGLVRACAALENGVIAPNALLVDTLFNVDEITFNFNDGNFAHERIFSGDDTEASLFAINGDLGLERYNLNFGTEIGAGANEVAELRTSNFTVHGGGNIALVLPGTGAIAPIVREDDGDVIVNDQGAIHTRLSTGIMASTPIQDLDENEFAITGLTLFDELKTHDAILEASRPNTSGGANAAKTGASFRSARTQIRVGAVANGTIVRQSISDVIAAQGTPEDRRERAIDIGAVTVGFDANNNIILAFSK